MNKKSFNPTANVPKNKRNVVGVDQIQMMISYMEEHSLFARGQVTKLGPQGHVKFKNMWIELTEKLNNLGPCILDANKWQEKWKNMRLNAKQRTAAYMHLYNKTGHCTPHLELNENDKRISDIFGKYGVGLNVTPECGFQYNSVRKSQGSVHLSIMEDVNVAQQLQYDLENSTQDNSSNGSIRKSAKVTDDQKEVLLQFMQNHRRFAQDLSDSSLWEELLSLLSAFEPIKTYQAWKRTWLDSVKAARQARALFDAGLRTEALSDYHTQILELMDSIESYDNDNVNTEEDVDMQCKTFKRPPSVSYMQEQKKMKTSAASNAVSKITGKENNFNVAESFKMQPNAVSPRPPLNTIAQPQPRLLSHTAPATSSSSKSGRFPAYAPISISRGMQSSSTTSAQGNLTQGRYLLQLRNTVGGQTSTSAAAAGAAKEKASTFMNAFKECQNDLLQKVDAGFERHIQFQKQSQQELMSSLPAVIESSLRKVLEEYIQPTLNNSEDDVPGNVQEEALIENNETAEVGNTFLINGEEYTLVPVQPPMTTEDLLDENVFIAQNDKENNEDDQLTLHEENNE